jgi:hypothetical protein
MGNPCEKVLMVQDGPEKGTGMFPEIRQIEFAKTFWIETRYVCHIQDLKKYDLI